MSDTFSNEYSVFTLNKTHLESSEAFKEIEDGFSFSIEKTITSMFNEKKNSKGTSSAYKFINEIMDRHFLGTYYSHYGS